MKLSRGLLWGRIATVSTVEASNMKEHPEKLMILWGFDDNDLCSSAKIDDNTSYNPDGKIYYEVNLEETSNNGLIIQNKPLEDIIYQKKFYFLLKFSQFLCSILLTKQMKQYRIILITDYRESLEKNGLFRFY